MHLNPVPFPCYSSPSPLVSKDNCMPKDTVPMYSKCSHRGNLGSCNQKLAVCCAVMITRPTGMDLSLSHALWRHKFDCQRFSPPCPDTGTAGLLWYQNILGSGQEGAIAGGENYSPQLPVHTWCLTISWLSVKQPHSCSRMNWFVRNEITLSGLID